MKLLSERFATLRLGQGLLGLGLAAVLTAGAAAQTLPTLAQPGKQPSAVGLADGAVPTQAPPLGPPPQTPVSRMVKVPEGTEVRVELGEKLSSASSAEGDSFSVVSDEEILLPDGTVIPPGYSGRGEVTDVSKAGMVGKSGQLNIRLDYLKVGDQRIRLRANKGGQGKSGVTNMVVTTVLIGPLGLLVRGHTITYPKGMRLVAYVDQDTLVASPPPPPPQTYQ